MRRIRIFEEAPYDYENYNARSYSTDWVDVSEEEYILLKKHYQLEELRSIQYYLEDSTKKEEALAARRMKQAKEEQARKEKAAKAAKTRKEKLLAKLKEELEGESNS